MKESFAGKVVLITGGTSGIGLATAEKFLNSGAQVVLVGSNGDKGRTVLKKFAEYGDDVIFICADITAVKECKKVVEQTVEYFGRLDILINSAGCYLEKSIGEVSEDDYNYVMDVNVKGTYFICKYAVPELKKAGSGAIVNISSDAGINGNVLCTTYCAAKGAITTFTKALALEVSLYGIRVNCVCPGDVHTPMLEKQLSEVEDKAEYLKEMASIYPMGRIGKPEEISEVICFLASDSAAFVTGAVWTVDGGLTAC